MKDKPLPDMIREVVNGVVDTAKAIFSKEGDLRPMFFLLSDDKRVMVVDVGMLMGSDEDKVPEIIKNLGEGVSPVAIMHVSESWLFDEKRVVETLGLTKEGLIVKQDAYNAARGQILLNLYQLYHHLYGSISHAPFAAEAITVTLDTIWGVWIRKIDIVRDGEKATLRDNPWVSADGLEGRFANILKKTPSMGPDGPVT